jgi:Arc/MetJ family transcription regulator
MTMRTNIVLDDPLVAKAFRLCRVRTKKELITTALREYVQNHSQRNIRNLRGKITFRADYDYKALRK